jgi:rhodanese-related sulfurtransferase/DNA-binding transcriptional ArsR family regulator
LNMNPTEKRLFKHQLYSQFARLGKALANSHRLELLELLAQGERSVEHLARETDMSIANTSQHLQVLFAAGLLEQRREGVFMFYVLANGAFPLWQNLRDLAQTQFAEVERLVSSSLNRTDQAVSFAELRSRLERGDTILLDVRPKSEFETAHIRGARPAPLAELEGLWPTLSPSLEVVVYCRGPYCVFADEAVALLRSRGVVAYRLESGLPDWQAAGYAVQKGASA